MTEQEYETLKLKITQAQYFKERMKGIELEIKDLEQCVGLDIQIEIKKGSPCCSIMFYENEQLFTTEQIKDGLFNSVKTFLLNEKSRLEKKFQQL